MTHILTDMICKIFKVSSIAVLKSYTFMNCRFSLQFIKI